MGSLSFAASDKDHISQCLCLLMKSSGTTNGGIHVCLVYHLYLSQLSPEEETPC